MDKNTNPTEGLAEIISLPKEIRCADGSTIALPYPTWRSELQVIASVGKILEHIGDSIGVTWEELYQGFTDKDKGILTKVVIKALEIAPTEITKIIASITGQTTAFVEENLDLPAILEILLPFLSQRIEKLLESMTRMDESLGRLTQGLSVKLSTAQGIPKKPR